MKAMRAAVVASLTLGLFSVESCKKQEAAPPQAQQPMAPQQQSAPTPTAAAGTSVGSAKGPAVLEKDQAPLPGTGSERELASLPEAEKALDQASEDLNKLLGDKGPAGGASRLAAGDARCPEACKAMSSLRRAAAAVCRLAGDATDRCTRAKGIVKGSEARLAACKCEPGEH